MTTQNWRRHANIAHIFKQHAKIDQQFETRNRLYLLSDINTTDHEKGKVIRATEGKMQLNETQTDF